MIVEPQSCQNHNSRGPNPLTASTKRTWLWRSRSKHCAPPTFIKKRWRCILCHWVFYTKGIAFIPLVHHKKCKLDSCWIRNVSENRNYVQKWQMSLHESFLCNKMLHITHPHTNLKDVLLTTALYKSQLKWCHFWGLCLFTLSQMDATQRINIVIKTDGWRKLNQNEG